MIIIKNLYKSINEIKIIDNINIEIKQSNIVGLAGPSGSGKSTLLRLIQKIEKQDSGLIDYNGKSSFMFQDFQLFPHMTIYKNITYSSKINKKTHYKSIAKEIIKNLNIESISNKYPDQISGGQKQRAALARSLIMEPDILLCDEPTSGLDVITINDVVALLKSVKKNGTTMIIASHDLDFLTKISDRIILIKNGQIIEDINVKEITNPIDHLKKLY